MRKIIAVLIMFALIASSACAMDLSGLSLDELHEIRKQVSAEILSRSEWGEVTVPVGFYVVGEDIPAGHWTIKYAPGEYGVIEYFLNTDDTGKGPADLVFDYYYCGVCDPTNSMASIGDFVSEFDLELKDGYPNLFGFLS